MNKTYLVAGGVAITSLAAGAAGGYFIARKKFDDTVGDLISAEVLKTKLYYEGLLQKAENRNKVSTDISDQEEELEEGSEEDLEEPEVLSEADQKARDKGRRQLAAAAALVNYQGMSITTEQKPDLKDVVEHRNIFTNNGKHRRTPPPRGNDGKFRKKTQREANNDPPQIVEVSEFLVNEREYEVEELLYFVKDKTLVQKNDLTEIVDISRVGEVNLTLFPDLPEGESNIIHVRNDGLSVYYEVTLSHGDLTEEIGFGEYSEGPAEDDGTSYYED